MSNNIDEDKWFWWTLRGFLLKEMKETGDTSTGTPRIIGIDPEDFDDSDFPKRKFDPTSEYFMIATDTHVYLPLIHPDCRTVESLKGYPLQSLREVPISPTIERK